MMVNINQGQASTILITIYGIIVTILATTDILEELGVPAKTATVIIGVATIIWNYVKPRSEDDNEKEEIA